MQNAILNSTPQLPAAHVKEAVPLHPMSQCTPVSPNESKFIKRITILPVLSNGVSSKKLLNCYTKTVYSTDWY